MPTPKEHNRAQQIVSEQLSAMKPGETRQIARLAVSRVVRLYQPPQFRIEGQGERVLNFTGARDFLTRELLADHNRDCQTCAGRCSGGCL